MSEPSAHLMTTPLVVRHVVWTQRAVHSTWDTFDCPKRPQRDLGLMWTLADGDWNCEGDIGKVRYLLEHQGTMLMSGNGWVRGGLWFLWLVWQDPTHGIRYEIYRKPPKVESSTEEPDEADEDDEAEDEFVEEVFIPRELTTCVAACHATTTEPSPTRELAPQGKAVAEALVRTYFECLKADRMRPIQRQMPDAINLDIERIEKQVWGS